MTNNKTAKVLEERGKRYGDFGDLARLSQSMKANINRDGAFDGGLNDEMQEALDLICTKIARIVTGDPYYEDSWRDIAGYSTLVADMLAEFNDKFPPAA